MTIRLLRAPLACTAGIVAIASSLACASGGRHSVASPPEATSIAAPRLESFVAIAKSAGERIRQEHQSGFAVLPVFLTSREHRVFTPDDSDQAVLLNAFREGANALYVDTAAVRDPSRSAQLPDSARYFYAAKASRNLYCRLKSLYTSAWGNADIS